MRNSIKLAAAIAAAGSTSAFAVCPTDTTSNAALAGAFPQFSDVCVLDKATAYTSDLTLTSENLWVLQGKTEIGTDVGIGGTVTAGPTLTIEAGTTIIGNDTDDAAQDPDRLVINRGAKIKAQGTAGSPIRFTGLQNLASGATTQAQWGGIYINGQGLTNECDDATFSGQDQNGDPVPTTATGTCERNGEANTGTYGGNDNADDSGEISYVTVAYAGDAFDPATDLNGVAFQGVGSGTKVSNIQVHANVDDGVEFYGGAVNVSNLVLTDNGDDSFDTTGGWVGEAQFVVISQTNNAGNSEDRAFESDNNKSPNDALPQTNATVANVTIVNTGGVGADVLKVRRGSALDLSNVVMYATSGTCFNIDDGDGNGSYQSVPVAAGADVADLEGFFYDCATVTDNAAAVTWIADEAAGLTSGTNSLDGYINGATENGIATADLSGSSFLQDVNFIGAVASCEQDWTKGWTLASTLPAVAADCDGVSVPALGWAGLVALFAGLAGASRLVRRIK